MSHNPQSIGRAFVKQYYTVLNEGPHILFRFYDEDSALLHADSSSYDEPPSPVYGQTNIYDKIMSLNFKNCRTKIIHVDCLETINNGVVIQVIGELSNDSQPMRRFIQTFVLVPRSETNYYVRTDIFRYQDQDEEELVEAEHEIEEVKVRPDVPSEFPTDSRPVENHAVASCPEPEVVASYENVNVNGEVNQVEVERPLEEVVEHTREILEKTKIESPLNNNIDEGYNEGEDRLVNDSSGSHGSEELEPSHEETNNQDEPKTYAKMVSRNPPGNAIHSPPFNHSSNFPTKPSDGANNVVPGNGALKNKSWSNDKSTENIVPSGASTVSPPSANNHQQTNVTTNVGKPTSGPHNRDSKGRPRASGGDQGRKPRHENRDITPMWSENDSSHGDAGGDYPGRRQQFSDEQQVFVGNLLQDITEDQLRNFFSKYGNIIDVRINRTNQKQGRTPNYGFVTFDDPSIVKKILAQKPIYFDAHRFNVEEKRSQTNRGSGNNSNRVSTGSMQGSNHGRTLTSSHNGSRQGGGRFSDSRGPPRDRERERSFRHDRERDLQPRDRDRDQREQPRGDRNDRPRKKEH
ncbi:ras GTPase-activating protein-binding protein 1-like [Brevipalpus obovatus]|uniref:ras GTPase-activating protein-binding protein 1-like n=1 Tax=Brevipalpus obovatus TaxID=246614 RepID=UPI003D9DC59D